MSVVVLGGSGAQPTRAQRLNVAANFCNIYYPDGENVTPFAELRSLMRNCKEMLLKYCDEHGIRYYKLERQRAAEAREGRGFADEGED